MVTLEPRTEYILAFDGFAFLGPSPNNNRNHTERTSVAISMKNLTFSIHSDGLETIRVKVSRTWIRESILLQIMSINSVV